MLESSISNLSDQALKIAFLEIQYWQKTGVLEDGIVRKTYDQYIKEINDDNPTQLIIVEKAFLYEMAKRYTNNETQ